VQGNRQLNPSVPKVKASKFPTLDCYEDKRKQIEAVSGAKLLEKFGGGQKKKPLSTTTNKSAAPSTSVNKYRFDMVLLLLYLK
jgi:hypothetical protein